MANDWPESLAPITIERRKRCSAKHIRKHLGELPVTKTDSLKVRGFYKMLREQGALDSTVISVN